MNYCQCGCGAEVKKNWVRGHHWAARRTTPPTKPCAICGATMTYEEHGNHSEKYWASRQVCGMACRDELNSRKLKGRILKEDIKDESGRARARKLYPLEPCEECGNERSERHHKDGDPTNNDRSNIAFLCRSHHLKAEYAIGRTRRT